MVEVLVACGGTEGQHLPNRRLIRLAIAPQGKGTSNLKLNLGRISRFMAAEVPPRLTDLVEIAAYVYATDQLIKRGGRDLRGMGASWRRRLRLRVPVRDHGFWSDPAVQKMLSDVLSFLSEDEWLFEFERGVGPPGLEPYLDFDSIGWPGGFEPDRVMMFSGGVDSVAGAAAAISAGERVVLVSHRSSPMLAHRQSELVDSLRHGTTGIGEVRHVHAKVVLGEDQAEEFTQRSRSFLFAVLGFVVAHMFGRGGVSFFENGIVSLNLPLADHILGARSTRTTHPRTLAGFSRLFSNVVGRAVTVDNPFFWKTKTEVVQALRDAGFQHLLALTYSCTRVRQGTISGQHCGVCSQCLDRRFAVLAAGAGMDDPAEGYDVDVLLDDRKPGPDVVLAEAYVLTAAYLRGCSEVEFLSRWGEVFRVLPHLDEGPSKAIARLHALHRRHGEAVARVIDDHLRQYVTLGSALGRAGNSLLTLITSGSAGDFEPAEPESTPPGPPPAGQRGRVVRPEQSEPAPILFGLDEVAQVLVFEGGHILRGQPYQLVSALMTLAREDWAACLRPENHRWFSPQKLAKRFGTDEPGLRTLVSRSRRALAKLFRKHYATVLRRDDFIENPRGSRAKGKGYRLNPRLVSRPPSYFSGPSSPFGEG